jgi:hypothetical protein
MTTTAAPTNTAAAPASPPKLMDKVLAFANKHANLITLITTLSGFALVGYEVVSSVSNMVKKMDATELETKEARQQAKEALKEAKAETQRQLDKMEEANKGQLEKLDQITELKLGKMEEATKGQLEKLEASNAHVARAFAPLVLLTAGHAERLGALLGPGASKPVTPPPSAP